jgi:hypothetical protein
MPTTSISFRLVATVQIRLIVGNSRRTVDATKTLRFEGRKHGRSDNDTKSEVFVRYHTSIPKTCRTTAAEDA